MAFADKYRKSVGNMTDTYLKKKRSIEEALKKLDEEERKKKAEWAETRKQLAAQASENDEQRLKAWGATVMASGFADEYENEFVFLSAIIRHALAQLKDNPDFRNQLLPFMKPERKASKGTKAPRVTVEPVDVTVDGDDESDFKGLDESLGVNVG